MLTHSKSPLLVSFLVLGITLRWYDTASILPWDVFDENKYVELGKQFIQHYGGHQDHPPFGKLLIGLSIHWFGNNNLGYRFFPTLMGSLLPFILMAISWELFQHKSVTFFTGVFASIDPFLIAHSRVALQDIILVTLGLQSLLFALYGRNRSWIFSILAGISCGLAASTKYNGAFALAPVVWCSIASNRYRCTFMTILFGAISYILVVLFAQIVVNSTNPIQAALHWQKESWAYHTSTMPKNIQSSSLYLWVTAVKPMLLRTWVKEAGYVRALIAAPNPLMLWVGLIAFGYYILNLLKKLIDNDTEASYPAGISTLLIAFSAGLLPWLGINRPSFFYHFLPSYSLLTILSAYILVVLRRKSPKLSAVIIFSIVTLSLSLIPIATARPVPEWYQQSLPACWKTECETVQ